MADFPPIEGIVPEYRSGNPLVRWLFLKRLDVALEFARLEEPRALDVVDLGCGEGRTLRLLRERHPRHRIVGIDHNPNVAKTLSIPGVDVRHGDLYEPGLLPAASQDRILCLDVLEHLQDLDKPLAAIRAALRPGGLLVISAPAENVFHKTCRFLIKGSFSEKEGPASSPHYHRASTLRPAIAAAGFTEVAARSLPLPGPLALIVLAAFRRTP
jgi:trans-aconitate methyltransferase